MHGVTRPVLVPLQAAALRPERWAWLTLTRNESDKRLTVYLNGREASVIDLNQAQEGELTDLHPLPIAKCPNDTVRRRRACTVCSAKGIAYATVGEHHMERGDFFLCQVHLQL